MRHQALLNSVLLLNHELGGTHKKEIMEIFTDEQREIFKLQIQLDVCKRDKDALRYQLSEAKRKAAQPRVRPTALQVRILNAICYGWTIGSMLWLLFGSQ